MAERVIYKGGDYVKTAFASLLRTSFKLQTLLPQYVYSETESASKLSIFESFPKRTFLGPSLVVGVGPASLPQTSISDFDYLRTDDAVVDHAKTSYAYGEWQGTASIRVVGLTDTDRRLVRDMAMFFCRYLFKVYAAQLGIAYNNVLSEGESEMEWQGQTLYLDRINILCRTEFQVTCSDELITGLNLTVNTLLGQ